MKNCSVFLVFLSCTFLMSQDKVRVYHKNVKGGVQIYADNYEHCPVTIALNFKLENMAPENENNIFVVSERGSRVKLISLKPQDSNLPYRFSFSTKSYYGNTILEEYDKDFHYYLPLEPKKRFFLNQGYNGEISHFGENKFALDFTMPIDTKIYAAREGTIVMAVDHNDKNCLQWDCVKYNNKILIYHNDGTFAEYVHLKYKGSKVKVGDKVVKGQHIGNSGNTGLTSGPHLHFSVYLPRIGKRETVPSVFLVNKGSNTESLKQNKSYLRNY